MRLGKFLHLLVVTDIYASLIAVAVPVISAAVLGLSLEPAVAFAVFFESLAIYALNRAVDRDIDRINNPERTEFVVRNGGLVLVFSLLGLLASLAYFAAASLPAFLLLSANFIASMLYSFPVLPGFLGFTRLKELFVGKNICVGVMYAAFALIPVLYAGAPLSPAAWIVFVFIAARLFLVSAVFDMRDVEGDARLGIPTIPVAIGAGSALLLLNMINAGTFILALVSWAYGALPYAFVFMSAATSLFGLYYLLESQKNNADLRFICGVVAEADIVPAALVAALLLIH
ncbi:MAG: UbiA family prenyltransferase [Candidatus Micrarchaeota archaeon]